MNPVTAGLLGAIIGACAGLIGSLGTIYFQNQLEVKKAHLAQENAISHELRVEIRMAAQHMLSLQHSMEWICWFALQDENLPDKMAIAQYHREVHETIPKLLGSMANVAAFDRSIYDQLQPLADDLFVLDGRIAEALITTKVPQSERTKILRENYEAATKMYKTLPFQLSGIQEQTLLKK